jgi:hypothetical protein
MRCNRWQAWRIAVLTVPFIGPLAHSRSIAADDYTANAARLQQMSAEEKEELSRKRLRFEELSPAEQERLRKLYGSIKADANADELLGTVTRYNRWLATLESAERSTLLDIKDPEQRIARMKELMQQQEERRFKQYFANLPSEDRATIYKWLADFVVKRADDIVKRLPLPVRQRLDEAGDDEDRRRELLFGTWQRFRRDFNLPGPGPDDYAALFERFTPETQKTIESAAANALTAEPEDQRTPERQKILERQRMEDIVRTAIYSRFFRQISQEELLRFYNAMKTDDPRRRLLEGKEGEELRRELQRLYNYEQMGGRGGPGPGGRGFGPPWPPPPPPRGPRPDGPANPDDGAKRPPPDDQPK